MHLNVYWTQAWQNSQFTSRYDYLAACCIIKRMISHTIKHNKHYHFKYFPLVNWIVLYISTLGDGFRSVLCRETSITIQFREKGQLSYGSQPLKFTLIALNNAHAQYIWHTPPLTGVIRASDCEAESLIALLARVTSFCSQCPSQMKVRYI